MDPVIVHAQPAVGGDQSTSPSRRIRGQRRHYTCAYCERVFKRSEHRIRHERTHTNEKPFSCRYCRRSYSRKDLVTRHERTLHAQGQAEPSAVPPPRLPVDGDCSSDGSLSDAGDPLASQRSRGGAAVASCAAADVLPSESGASPASMKHSGAAPMEALSPSSALNSTLDEAAFSKSSVIDPALDRLFANDPHLVQALAPVSADTVPTPATSSGASASTRLTSQRSGIYPALQDGFNMYDASSQLPMDVDLNNNHEQGQMPPPPPPQQQITHEFQPFSQFEAQSPSTVSAMNQDLDAGHLSTFDHGDMSSYFAFSPFPAGLFEVGQNMPTISTIPMPDIFEYPAHPNPTPRRIDAAITPASALLPAPSPSHHQIGNHPARSSRSVRSETSGNRETPSNLPRLVKDKPPRIPNFIADDTLHAAICKDISERVEYLGQSDISKELPSSKLLQGFLSSFMECYYRHQPFIHLPTLSTVDTPSPLTLAMCCIGALYRLDRRRAQRLYTIGTQSIAADVQRIIRFAEEEPPLWVVQTKLLFSAYATLSGDQDLAQSSVNENGFYSLVYNKKRLALATEDPDIHKMTWQAWVQRESWKRMLGGIYVASTIAVIIWDANPGFNTSSDLEIEVLHDESLWQAKTAAEWSELRGASASQQEYQTLRDGLASILSDNSRADSPRITACRLSPFTALLLMHAVVVHVWQVVQVAQSLGGGGGGAQRDPVSSMLMSAAVRSLARAHELLVNAALSEEAEEAEAATEGEAGGGVVGAPRVREEGTSQIFNCQATLRMAYIRLFSVANGVDRPSLMTSDPAAVRAFASSFAVTKLERSPQLFDAVVKAFEGLRIPVRMGHMLVRKTAALRWSPAHAIAGWDCALFVCKWVHSIEMDRLNGIEPSPAECEFLDTIKDVLEEAEYDPGKSRSLAAGVARTWSFLLQDVWVWSITPRMGAVLEQMAAAFERVNDANRRPGT